MADKDGDGPSLELPSLGFGRKRAKKAPGADPDVPSRAQTAEPVVEPEPDPEAAAVPEDETSTAPESPTTPIPAAAPSPAPEHTPEPAPSAPAAPAAPPLFADELQERPARSETTRVDELEADDADDAPRRQFSLPAVSGMTAALATGAIAGLLMVGLTAAGFRLCELVQGTSSCGDPGYLLLLAIVVVVVVVGKAMLDAWSVTDPGSTSFLAVGLLCVVALLFLVDVLFNWWMVIVIPVISMVCFALSHWVTTAFVETDE